MIKMYWNWKCKFLQTDWESHKVADKEKINAIKDDAGEPRAKGKAKAKAKAKTKAEKPAAVPKSVAKTKAKAKSGASASTRSKGKLEAEVKRKGNGKKVKKVKVKKVKKPSLKRPAASKRFFNLCLAHFSFQVGRHFLLGCSCYL